VNSLAAALSLLGAMQLCAASNTALLNPHHARTSSSVAVAGAIPAPVGSGRCQWQCGLGGLWLFSLVMLWTPAHFWALALLLAEDYARWAISRCLPVIKGAAHHRAIGHYARAHGPLISKWLECLALPNW